jgi:DNA-binding PadR family transcriptional regulator
MYELVILSLLIRFPANGYRIAHIINDIMGPYTRISNGRLYPLLAKMEEQGLIGAGEGAEQGRMGERNSRVYTITEQGRERFHWLMIDTTMNPGEYQRIFMIKVTVLHYLPLSERLYVIEHYITYCQAHIQHLTNEADDLARANYSSFSTDTQQLPATLNMMHHLVDGWRLEVAWAQQLLKAEQERADQAQQDTEMIDNEQTLK